ncbi:hypothetical protein TONV_071 [Tipula oleracea nudivirus]|uniref:Uncharacterized protein n=1 Tax=Tipula oleracea nudivirus TaxID=1546257 RepID=A0A0B4VG86_9VIRU|nr:hypothetical protein TONV_071 [Tipula oleracea nudivirus]AJD20131.1 hypothetical protein TONV_071 [Tipula oleracea nudivirus]
MYESPTHTILYKKMYVYMCIHYILYTTLLCLIAMYVTNNSDVYMCVCAYIFMSSMCHIHQLYR